MGVFGSELIFKNVRGGCMKAKLLGMTFIFICYFGCAPLPVPRQIVQTFTIKAPFNQGWEAVIESFADFLLPIQNSEKASGRITTDWVKFTSQVSMDYCYFGELGLMVEKNRRGKFLVTLKKTAENSCEITTNFSFEQNYTNLEGTKHYNRKGVSTGKLETKMYEMIKSKVRERKP